MIKTDLYERTLYLNKDIDYLLNCEIREYDLKSAGMNLIKYFHLASDKVIHSLERMDKDSMHKEIGMMQKDTSFAKAMSDAFVEARRIFFDANDIDVTDILSIKKDAIFLINKKCSTTQFGNMEFRVKNTYLGYMYLNKVEFYFTDSNTPLDVKGLGNEIHMYHDEYMLDFIRDIFAYSIYAGRKELIKYLTEFIDAYRTNRLAYGYYRHLDSDNFYTIIDPEDGPILIKDIDDQDEVTLDITYNYFNYLVPIANIFI